MKKTSKERGRSLEKAVKFIQEMILRADPQLKGTQFTIEANKIVTVAGVRHEIDVFVQTLAGSAYESSWLFECKNQQAPVGKNDVLILSAKVDAIGANRGFLVARRLTKDAKAQSLEIDSYFLALVALNLAQRALAAAAIFARAAALILRRLLG